MSEDPQVTKSGVFDMQVCVPESWDDYQVLAWIEGPRPSGTENGWQIRKEGHEALQGAKERVSCAQRKGYVHIMLEC